MWKYLTPILLPVCVVMTLMLSATPAQSQAQPSNCAPRSIVIDRLADQYGESRQTIALTANQSLMEIYANEETGSWTATITQDGQISCMVAAGTFYDEVNEELPDPSEQDG